MKKFLKSPVFLILCAVIVVAALISWFAFDWSGRTNGLIEMLGIVIVAVVGVAANLVSIWKDTHETNEGQKPEKLPRLPARGKLPPPGDLPAGSRMAHPRNECFTGRERDLLALADALLYADEAGRVTVTQTLAATGLGGIGKTQLAVEFCCRYGRFFEGVHWLDCRAGELESEIAACGQAMGLQPWPEAQPGQVAATLRAWEKSRRRLVVLDNLEDPETLRVWLPRLSHCRLLLTARRPDWPAELGLATYPLGLLARPESLELLRRLAPRLQSAGDADLAQVAERLGDLPLALDLAGRYLNEREHLSPRAYLEALQSQENLLAHSSLLDWVEGSPTRHETSLAATFNLSWDRLDGEGAPNPLARKIFLLAGWCAPNAAIPSELLAQAAGAPEEDFDRALLRLHALGLLERLAGGPGLHPLLAAFSGSLQAGEEKMAHLAALVDALARLSRLALETGLPREFLGLRPHMDVVATAVEKEDPTAAAPLWNNLGYYLEMIADLAGARACYERALRIDEAAYGADHPEVATDVNNLGGMMQAQGDLAGARACYERALRIAEAVYGAEHPVVASVVNNLGLVLREQGDLAGARTCYERALHIDKAVYGANHPKVAGDVNNLGLVLWELGDLAGARVCFERALRIAEATYGADHPNVATNVNNLGNVLLEQGDLAGARGCFERALRIDEATYGTDHPNVARDVNNLGSVLKAQGDLAGAKECYERALRLDEAIYGAEHPEIATDVNNLGSVLRARGDLAGARACFEHALRIDEAVYGADHPMVARDVNNLGSVMQAQGDLAGARGCFERALCIFEKFLPPDHPNIRIARENLDSLE